MIQIRRGVFETNSSSCHTLVIRKDSWFLDNPEYNTYTKYICVRGDYYGRGREYYLETLEERLNYIWTMVICLFGKTCVDWTNKIYDYTDIDRFNKWKDMIHKVCPNADLIEPPADSFDYGIDHVDDLMSFAEELEKNPDLLMYFLLNDSSGAAIGSDEYFSLANVFIPYSNWGKFMEYPGDYLVYVKGN